MCVRNCEVDFNILGYAYYNGFRNGDNWNKKALDVTIFGNENDLTVLRNNQRILKDTMEKFLRPSKSGLLINRIEFVISTNSYDISLPDDSAESFDVLSADIHDAIKKDQPALVLDRLHTYITKYLRKLCNAHSIPVCDERGNFYPLHSLFGLLRRYYERNSAFQSDFVNTTFKASTSVFERFNAIRNDSSYAHVNDVLNKAEAKYVISIITAILQLLKDIDN